ATAAGMRVSTTTKSPPTACASAARSVVVATTRNGAPCADAEAAPSVAARTAPNRYPRITLSGGDPRALRHQAVHGLLGRGRRCRPAVHDHAGERVGVEAAQAL